MQQGSTYILRGTVLVLGLITLGLSVLILPPALDGPLDGYSPIFFGMYVTMIPFYVALYQTMKLLRYIDKNSAFSTNSVKALEKIKYCALTIGALYAAGMPYIYYVAEIDDAPGVIAIGLVLIGASISVATFAAVLQKLLQNAIDIKSENDLTV